MKIKLFHVFLALLLMFAFAGCGDDSNNYVPPTNGSESAGAVEDVRITYIFYDGQVFRSESDEYVEITNVGNQPQELTGCMLIDIDEGYPHFVFPYYILEPGRSVRVYTNEIHPDSGGFSFGYGKAIWNNTDPDTAVLYDSQGNELSRMSY